MMLSSAMDCPQLTITMRDLEIWVGLEKLVLESRVSVNIS